MTRRRKTTTAADTGTAVDTLELRGLTVTEADERREELREELADLVEANEDRNELDPDDEARFTELTEGIEYLDSQHEKRSKMLGLIERGAHDDAPSRSTRGTTDRDVVLRNLESDVKAKHLSEDAATGVEALLRGEDSTTATRWARAAGDPAYRSAFGKMLADPSRGHLEWTAAESEAYRNAQNVQRAMNEGSSAAGLALVPLSLDPTVVLTSDGSTNPIRKIARNETVTGQAWRGVSSAGVQASWTPEAQEMADASPTLAAPVVPVHKATAFVPFSWEVEQDSADLLGQLQILMADGLDQLTNTAFTTGTGVGQPRGVATALAAAGAPYVLTPAAPETLSPGDVYKLQQALPPRFQAGAQFAANLAIINILRQFETGNGSKTFPELADGRLLSRSVNELSNLEGFNPAVTDAANLVLIYGDWKNYLCVNRIGASVEFIQNLTGPNGRPTGQRGIVLYTRIGGDVINSAGFRALNIATTA
ncbi:phage major capsid protein [Rhodococcoides fascians A25f]|uniref:phage major capsid protein n=1 Tax=Rhodococcoides fascians TaxID=1828 RepID=UPI00068ED7FC|nr:phage major capsid protein [Rhodococcus fascians]QII06955.1 phage major capsid protein [Rhodococcus fascians A25f]